MIHGRDERITFTKTTAINKRQALTRTTTDEKARKDLADKAKGKGPLNTGNQGIKKSGKK